MTEFPLICPYCSRSYKTLSGFLGHMTQKHSWTKEQCESMLELGPEEVTPESDPGEGLDSLSEPSPPPDATLAGVANGEPRPSVEGGSPQDLFQVWVNQVSKDITTLNTNQQGIREDLNKYLGNQYEAVQSAEGGGASWSFDEFPEWLKEPAIKFLGDIGAAARSLAGGAPSELSVDERIIREAVQLTRDQVDSYVASKAANIARAMADPDLSVVALPKEDVDKLE